MVVQRHPSSSSSNENGRLSHPEQPNPPMLPYRNSAAFPFPFSKPPTGKSFLSGMDIAAHPEHRYSGALGAFAVEPIALREPDGWQPKKRSHSWSHQEQKHELQQRLAKSDDNSGFSEVNNEGVGDDDTLPIMPTGQKDGKG